MVIVSEAIDKKQQVLIVDSKPTRLSRDLKEELKKFSNEVYVSPRIPPTVHKFDYVFLVNSKIALKSIYFGSKQKVVFLFIGQSNRAQTLLKSIEKEGLDYKVVSSSYDQLNQQELEKALWFALSKSNEKFLHIGGLKRIAPRAKINTWQVNWKKILTPRRVIIWTIVLLFTAHLLTFPFVVLSSYLYYRSATSLKKTNSTNPRDFVGRQNSYSLRNLFTNRYAQRIFSHSTISR
jgi:hypothetical protein